jgi:hypothetical protein
MPATPRFNPARADYAGYLASVLVLCAASIASSIVAAVISTLVTIRLLEPHAPSLGHLLRIVLSRALLLVETLGIRP